MSNSPLNLRPTGQRAATRSRNVKLGLTRAVMVFERLMEAGWPLIGLIALFVAAALLEVPQSFGGWSHGGLLALFALGLVWAVRRLVRSFTLPIPAEVLRRLETSSGLEHRPLSTLDDGLANSGDPVARAMWEAHRQRLLEKQPRLSVGEPKPVLSRVDPFAIHGIIGVALVVGVVVSGASAPTRLVEALTPRLDRAAAEIPTLDLWINPPAYTGLAPVLLTHPKDIGGENEEAATSAAAAGTSDAIDMPVNSRVLATVNGGVGTPELRVIGEADEAATIVPFDVIGIAGFRVDSEIASASAIEITQEGRVLGRWDVSMVPDMPPTVEFVAEPEPSDRGALSLYAGALDDYGVVRTIAEIRRVAADTDAVTAEDPIMIELPLPRIGGERALSRTYHDLTPHPWAGQVVEIMLTATDDVEQTGSSEPVRITLPERVFFHPVARAIIEQRKRLVVEDGAQEAVARVLMALAARPGRYNHDVVVFLSLKTASSRLALSAAGRASNAVESVLSQLWDTALRIEDGDLSLAERRLRELERQLQEALANDAPQERIEQLMDQLQDAIDEYLNAMQEQMREMMQRQQAQPNQQPRQQQMPQDGRQVDRQQLKDMVERARDMARSGSRESAREMLSQLQEMMENMRAGIQPQMSPEQQAMQEMMRQLGEMARQQQQLMDQTFRQRQQMNEAGEQSDARRNGQQSQRNMGGERQGTPRRSGNQGLMTPDGGPQNRSGQTQSGQQSGQTGQLGADDLAELQEALRRQLGEFMRRIGEGMGDIPEGFGGAERSMKSAVDALQQGQPGEATGPQGDALQQLQQGTNQLMENLEQQLANGQGPGNPNTRGMNQGNQEERDPLDRARAGYGDVDRSDVDVPSELDAQRAREIFQELRRRSGDRSRPSIELDYIDRLLDRF